MFGINKILLIGGGVAAILIAKKYWQPNKNTQSSIVVGENPYADVNKAVDVIRNRLHDYLKHEFPNVDDLEIAKDVLYLTSNLDKKIQVV